MKMRLSRRGLLVCACCGVAGAALRPRPAFAAGKRTDLTADQALALLKEGNSKYVADSAICGVMSRERRLEIAKGQTPFAVLVSCSDSRVPPEPHGGAAEDRVRAYPRRAAQGGPSQGRRRTLWARHGRGQLLRPGLRALGGLSTGAGQG
jgi:hypothetical protein